MSKNKEWVMPDWMEKYRGDFNNTGGNSVEDLHNSKATIDTNVVVCLLSSAIHGQVHLLETLHEKGIV